MKRTLTLVTGLLAFACSSLAASPRPNIVLILADDLGYETIGANGGQSYATPHLDALAGTGVRFRHAYAQPVCTPTRTQLMTGKYNIRNYDAFGILIPGQVTFANLLRDAGYKTFIGGKWQLDGGFDVPIAFGFDEYFLSHFNQGLPSVRRYYAPTFVAHIPSDGLIKTAVEYPVGNYGPDRVVDKTLEFIERNQAVPFLAYCTIPLTHRPFTPTPDHPDYDPSSTTELNDTVYFGSMVEYLDKLIGRFMGKLDELGLRENTLVLFMGDNGTGDGVTTMFEGHPVEGGKGKLTDAGTRVPFIASWPNTIPSAQVTDTLVDSSDMLPTLCEVAGVPVPQGLDGRSLRPQLLGLTGTPREWTFCWYKHQVGNVTKIKEFARTQRFKLYQTGDFYDLANDPLEHNLLKAKDRDAEAQAAFALLTDALDSFDDARLDRSLAPRWASDIWQSRPAAFGAGSIAMAAATGIDSNGPVEYQFRNVSLLHESDWQSSPYYCDSGLDDGTSYSYQFRMRDLLANTSDWSDQESAVTLPSANPAVVIIEQPAADQNSNNPDLGQSFTAAAAHDGWFLDSVTFYAAGGGNETGPAYLSLYDGFASIMDRGNILSVSDNPVAGPTTQGAPMIWSFSNIVLKEGVRYFAAISDSAGRALPANSWIRTQQISANEDTYDGGSRIGANGESPGVDLKFAITARRFPANFGQWTLGIPPGLPRGFDESQTPGDMTNGWKYFLGLGPLESDFTRWPGIEGGNYVFLATPTIADLYWRIHYTPNLQAPPASWLTAEPGDPNIFRDPLTGAVRFAPPRWPNAFFRLEIGPR